MQTFEKAMALRNTMARVACDLQIEDNRSAAQLVADALRAINTLCDRDAARLFDAIRRGEA